jgi:hypothetical protein
MTEEKRKYKRFCRVCGRQTYEWECCGKRTGRVNLQSTIADKLTETLVENADQDECQLMDELNEEWVQAWRQAVKAT